jgi:hypothetical protein
MMENKIRSFELDNVENWFIVTRSDLDSGVQS